MSFSVKNILNWKLIIALNLLLLFFFSFNFIKEYNRNRQLNAEIKKLEGMAKEVEAKNLDILNLAQYLDTEEFLETEARVKLGFKKPGEDAIVVNMPAMGEATSTGNKVIAGNKNYQKWWSYFFGRDI
ncbi:MAG: septum formation initiator family protein [Patescibacteria group bacterium]